jgi:hypothetical protein
MHSLLTLVRLSNPVSNDHHFLDRSKFRKDWKQVVYSVTPRDLKVGEMMNPHEPTSTFLLIPNPSYLTDEKLDSCICYDFYGRQTFVHFYSLSISMIKVTLSVRQCNERGSGPRREVYLEVG